MSGDPTQDYFSDGMTEDLITDLSKISGLFVVSRSAVFRYKGKGVSPEQVSRELGIRHVLEGSVRKDGDKVRINAQLIDATTGGNLWAERYDPGLKRHLRPSGRDYREDRGGAQGEADGGRATARGAKRHGQPGGL
jgi:TolB-like protein